MNTLGELLMQAVEKNHAKPALGFVNEPYLTYGELWEKVQSVSSFLDRKGIKKGDKVGLLSTNQPNWGVAYFAVVSMGAVIVPILPDFSESEVSNVMNHAEVKAMFVSDGLYRKIQAIECASLQFMLLVDNLSIIPNGTPEVDLPKLNSVLVEPEKMHHHFTVNSEDIASIIYTSGTTGKSKGVMLTHKNLVFTAINSGKIHPMGPADRMLSVLPLSHTYENTIGLLLPLMSGVAIYYLRKPPVPSVLLPALKTVKPTIMLTVPLIIEKVYKGKVLPSINGKLITRLLYRLAPMRKVLNGVAGKKLMETFGGQLKFFGIGGAKLDPQVERFLIEAKFPYAVGYGLTETSPLLAGFDSFQGKYQSTGPSMQGVTLKINDPDAVTGQGEIWAKGDNVMKGYYKEPEITAEVITEDGWFKTGDLGCFDKNGYLFIKGRLKNMIISASGENIYPEDIEAIINRFKHVLESVVVQQKGKLVAMVHFNREEVEEKFKGLKDQANNYVDKQLDDLTKELQVYVNSQVSKFARVQMVIAHMEPFEKTATKKIKRFLYY
ncbi:MAG: AMP-binding protein [Prolixibacteraceae bacterium]